MVDGSDGAQNADLGSTLGGESAGEQDTDSASQFFVSKKAAAVLKHEILRQYVVPFVGKVGSTSTDARVVYLDGYAGPGTYSDGTHASPSLVLESAANVSQFRKLECIFVERGRKDFERLQGVVKAAQDRGINAEARSGRVQNHLDYVLERARGVPLLAFLDPFGLGIPFDDLVGKIFGPERPQNSQGWIATEVLLNFSANAVRRIGGLLTTTKAGTNREATLNALDLACGGAWWRQEYLASADNTEAVQRIAWGFARRVCDATSASAWVVPVRNRSHHQPVYHLVFFTRHKDGIWLFGEANSIAQEKWRAYCAPPPPPKDENALFDIPDTFEAEELARKRLWIDQIKVNILALLDKNGSFVIKDHHRAVLGDAIAGARKLHIRAAVKELYAERRTGCNGVGDVETLRITPPV
ncbi:three-Cys-motif partner protein TcmP [Dactylosporangium sp. CA-139114]|uniref:three-Cys-motif partner protein TcmP n=1 Tax=Dactylosporangium sp. CA-139114 TaxID=3239931 RepID=UPI003D977E67